MLIVFPEFESPERCEAMISAARGTTAVRELPNLREVAAGDLVKPSLGRIRDTIVRAYECGDVDLDYAAVTEMRVGASHRAHADAERRTRDGRWEPNHTPQRTFTALLYLNSNPDAFVGGELVFRHDEVTVTPKVGTLVLAPTSGRYEHEVREVTHGTRWLLAVWFKRLDRRPATLVLASTTGPCVRHK